MSESRPLGVGIPLLCSMALAGAAVTVGFVPRFFFSLTKSLQGRRAQDKQMKSIIFAFMGICSIALSGQSRKDLIEEIRTYKWQTVVNQQYNVSKQQLFDAMMIVM